MKTNLCSDEAQIGEEFGNQFDSEGKMRIIDGMRYYKKNDTQNNIPRCIIKLKEPVDKECLEYAAEVAMKRHRVFRLTVVRDDKRFYLKTNDKKPVVHLDDEGRHTVGTEENNGYLTRIGYNGNTISVEFFHGVSDGMGLIAFNKTLLYYYGSKKYGKIEPVPSDILLEETPEDPREYADSLLFIPNEEVTPGKKYEYDRAFQIHDTQMKCEYECKYYELKISAEEFENYMRRNSSSRSAVFALMMNRTIAECNNLKDEPIVAALAVNARGAYGAEKTTKCCVATIPLWYDKEISKLTLSEQLKTTRQMIVDGTQTNNIIASAQRTKKFNETLEERFPALEEKKAFACKVNKQGGIKYTYGISYIGETKYGKGIDEHIEESYLMLCANTIPIILEIAKCSGYYHISYCTHLEADPYVFKLRDMFLAAGIPCTCVQKENFAETIAIF